MQTLHTPLRFFFCLIILLQSFISFSQAPSIYWQKTFGGSASEIRALVRATSDHGFILGGFGSSSNGDIPANSGGQDIVIIKMDSCGRKQWTKLVGGSGLDLLYGLTEVPGGGYYFAGSTTSTTTPNHHGGMDGIVGRLDAAGNTIWIKAFGGSLDEVLSTVVALPDGSCVISGWTISPDGDGGATGNTQGWVIKIDGNGNLVWKKLFGGPFADAFFDVAPSNDGGFVMGGYISVANGNGDLSIVKIDANGNTIWQKTFGGPLGDGARTVRACNGGYVVAGTTSSNSGDVSGNHGGVDAWIVKVDESGNLLWQKCVGGSAQEDLWEMTVLPNDQYVFAAGTASADGDISGTHGTQDALAFSLDANGNILWLKNYGGSLAEQFFGVASASDGALLFSGSGGSNDGDISGNHGLSDLLLFKLKNKVMAQVDTTSCRPVVINSFVFDHDTSFVASFNDKCGYDSAAVTYNITITPSSDFVQSIADATINAGDQVVLTTTASGPVEWTGVGLSCTTCLSPTVKPLVDSRYIVSTGTAACKMYDTVNIHVIQKDSLYIPTAFTPDGNGLNDIFRAVGSASAFNMKVYNRWGQLVFESKTLLKGWDGSFEGKAQPAGVYVFLVRYKNAVGKDFLRKGTVMLIR